MQRYILLGLLISGSALAEDVSPLPRVADIQWPDTGPMATSSGDDRLKPGDIVQLPVFIPEGFLEFRTFRLVAEPYQYMASVEANWGTMQLFGTRILQEVPGAKVDGSAAVLTANFAEQSVEVGQQRYGAAYLLRIECRAPTDQRCAKADYAMTLLTEAQIMGGQPSGRPAIAPSTPPADGPVATSSAIDGFNYDDPGVLTASGGQGNKSGIIYAPGIRFPVEKAPTFLGSMVYGYGGSKSPEKNRSWKDRRNYRYPWQDNFCEPREYRTSLCPSGKGHQGVDIRPARAPIKRERIYWAVAAEDGVIGAARGYTVTLLGNSGTRYDYLHLEMAQLSVKQGARVKAGDRIGLISDNFGKTVTPVHLHFEIRQFVPGKGVIPVPPYMSLVRAYERM